ncbi:UNVERIFIED_CONTAM: redoxin domain-containing protein [Halobacillus marinus]|uniref:redoxin domain-containing protein n=1 Tax=Bacillus sp. SB49 TaxID=1071080 RepID=UPI00054DDCC7|nr:redoxin domain-containing protein [Bacillus sp. SB49]QHT46757.1 redoxin domain-containing protein [Bacillus sp. SB49]
MKQWLALAFLLVLFAMVVLPGFGGEDEKTGERDTEEKQGAGMVAPNAPDGLEVGEAAPDFTVETVTGEIVRLSDYRGKKVFLNYWTTWCPPCREEMPEMQKFYEAFSDEVEILAVNGTGTEDGGISMVRDFISSGEYTFPVLLDEQLEINETYQILAIPTTYFIGTDGIIQKERRTGPMTYEFMVKMKDALN